MTDKSELLAETINIIIDQLLLDATFCGSVAGRRLRELRWVMTDGPIKLVSPRTSYRPREYVSSTFVLPVILDTALSAAADKAGISRDALVEGAVAALFDENRLG